MALDKIPRAKEPLSDEELSALVEKVTKGEEQFAKVRTEYQLLSEKKDMLQARLDALGADSRDSAYAGLRSDLDNVIANIGYLDQLFKTAQGQHAVNVDSLEDGIRRRLN